MMTLYSRLIEFLNLALQGLQQGGDTVEEAIAIADLKCILLNRIAELQVVPILEFPLAELPRRNRYA